MKKSCRTCGNVFKGRKERKFCSLVCQHTSLEWKSNIGKGNKGKLLGNEAFKKIMSEVTRGPRNSMFGRHTSIRQKEETRRTNSGHPSWNKGFVWTKCGFIPANELVLDEKRTRILFSAKVRGNLRRKMQKNEFSSLDRKQILFWNDMGKLRKKS